MIFDLVSSVQLTASAAVVVAVLIAMFGRNVAERALIGGGLAIWFACVVWAGAAGVLNNDTGFGTKGLGVAAGTPVVAMSLMALGTSWGRRRVAEAALPVLVGVQALRVLGIRFVMLNAAGRLPATFALSAGWGDITVGMLAIPMALWLWRGPGKGRLALLGWNVLGVVDLVTAIFLGATSAPGPMRLFFEPPGSGIITTLPWILIPCFLVPSFLFLHVVTFARLGERRGEVERDGADRVSHSGAAPAR